MDSFLKDWTPTAGSTHAALRVPANAGPVDFKLRITPGALEPEKQTVLLTAVSERWAPGERSQLAPRFWMLWQVKVFAAHGKAVVEMDGRGPEKRQVEPLKSRLRWDRGMAAAADDGAYEVAITYNAALGGLTIDRTAEPLVGTTFLKTTEPWTLLVGKPPSFIDELALPAGWRFDLEWEIPGRAPVPVEPPPPVDPPPTDIEQIDTSLSLIEDEVNAARRALRRMKGGA